MKVEDVLKQAGVKDEVIAGLPPEVTTALSGYAASADNKLAEAQQAETNAREQMRLAGLTQQEIDDKIASYGLDLSRTASVEAQNKALTTYIESLKEQGFDVKLPSAVEPAVPGSPARGGNVQGFDATKFQGEVTGAVSQLMDFNDAAAEYQRLTGQLLPEGSKALAKQAQEARKPLGSFIAEKFNFDKIRQDKSAADEKAKLDAARKEGEDAAAKKYAEKFGSNPMTASGRPSTNGYVQKINRDDLHKADGYKPTRQRHQDLLEKIHKDLASQQTA